MGITRTWNRADRNVCKYEGFACDYRPDFKRLSVAAADFNGYNFSGPDLQTKGLLDKLVDLAIFHANSNKFKGSVPDDIGVENIKYFYELDLSNNNYHGGFPTSVLAARQLTFLDISQQLPNNVGSTSALYLTFANNLFTGPIPNSIGRAKRLREVLLLGNNFSGCLPYEIGFLKTATVFDASCNKLTGPIPHSFACLTKIQILNLATNEFYGPVPEMVCKLPNLQNLSLSGNYFTQVGPECRKLIWMKRLDVRKNCIFDLPNQRTAQECREFFSKPRKCPNEKSLTIVPCSKNYGNAAAEFDQQSTVAAPPISYDALSPQNKPDTGVPSVAAINFNGYNFSGPDFQIQGFVDKLLDLSIFHANSNGFNGNVPNELDVQNINFLFELDLSNNKYTGGFPMSVLGATNLTFLDIRFNSFSGRSSKRSVQSRPGRAFP
ncbi:hypothetical protein GH714_033342 [Hevea brasiliensis]|uniref:Leucine-rich repeat-containing N-terminal plant-type domain-containing protein n=1 Tax=Hevea brasiliensis TaxID=3981 RepID=A0A6A6N5W6_HEVBR|nr:hypothetical protein GH714_033342 [Hevea brasiliensis]